MNNEEFYELLSNAELGETECPRCEVTIIHHKDHKIQFCGMCEYEFEEE